MLKRTVVFAATTALAATTAFAHGNPRAEVKARVGKGTVSVEYGRPSLQGRDMLGQAAVGTAWRMGADAPTTLATDTALRFGDKAVPAGRYVLKALKASESEWRLQLTSDGEIVAEAPLTARPLDESVELLTIELGGTGSAGRFEMRWGTLALSTDFAAE